MAMLPSESARERRGRTQPYCTSTTPRSFRRSFGLPSSITRRLEPLCLRCRPAHDHEAPLAVRSHDRAAHPEPPSRVHREHRRVRRGAATAAQLVHRARLRVDPAATLHGATARGLAATVGRPARVARRPRGGHVPTMSPASGGGPALRVPAPCAATHPAARAVAPSRQVDPTAPTDPIVPAALSVLPAPTGPIVRAVPAVPVARRGWRPAVWSARSLRRSSAARRSSCDADRDPSAPLLPRSDPRNSGWMRVHCGMRRLRPPSAPPSPRPSPRRAGGAPSLRRR